LAPLSVLLAVPGLLIPVGCCFFALSRAAQNDCITALKRVSLVPGGGWRMRFVGCGLMVLAAMAAVAPARAADLPVAPAYTPATPPPPAIYNWSGFYIGGNVGAGPLHDSATQTTTATAVTLPGPINVNPVGLVGGAQAGFDYQFSSVVVGAQAAWSGSNIRGNTVINATTAPPGGQERLTSAVPWFASATGRIGYAANTLLFYVKGGGAWMHIEHVQDILIAGGALASSQAISDNRSGFTAGVGLEYALTQNLSALFEYDFYDFGTKTENFSTTIGTPLSIKSDLHTLTVGLNYRFNWGSYGQPFCPTC
jgi:outer membrane immunogenic protein